MVKTANQSLKFADAKVNETACMEDTLLPSQRRKIYVMNRFEDKSVTDISEELNISRRTVENHLFISRKAVSYTHLRVSLFHHEAKSGLHNLSYRGQ